MRHCTLLVLLLLAAPLSAWEPAEVVILANSKAEGSVELADFYAEARGIPKDHILTLSTSDKEEISRAEFTKEIWEPVRKFIKDRPKVLYLVPTRGVPLKVRHEGDKPTGAFDGHTEACVDSELMLARADSLTTDGAVDNPTLQKESLITVDDKVLIVCRLDGPSVEIVRGMVEKALLAEACTPEGHSYLDTRGLTADDGYTFRDKLMVQVQDAWKMLDLPFTHDTNPDVVDLSTFKGPLHYYGWYAGSQKPAGAVRFRTGGICIHLHSYSAGSVRNVDVAWVAPLLSWNATCAYGTVYEPYTIGFPYEHLFWNRLARGWNFGQAGMIANHKLSWQSVFCGDPLYTPYRDNWKDTRAARRQALAALISARAKKEAEPALELDEGTQALLRSCTRILSRRAEAIIAANKTDSKAAMAQLDELSFLVRGLELDSALGLLLEPLNRALKQQLDAIKAEVKADLTNTAALEEALVRWKGLAIEKDLLEFRDAAAADQDKEAASLLKTANSRFKSKRYLDAWKACAQAQRYRLSGHLGEAKGLQDEINADAKAREKMLEAANKELKALRETAQKDFDRKKYDKAEAALKPVINDYPDCDEKTKAQDLLKQAQAKLKEAPPKGK